MGREIDLDAFSFGDEVELDPPKPPTKDVSPGVRPEVAAAALAGGGTPEPLPPEPMQQTLDGAEVPHAKNVTPPRTRLRALVYVSQPDGDGEGHIVVLHDMPSKEPDAETRVVACNCKAMRNLFKRPQGCWAMVDAREVLGLPAIGGPP